MSNLKSSGTRRPQVTRSTDPFTKMIVSKLVTPEVETSGHYRDPNIPLVPPSGNVLSRMANRTAINIRDNQNIFAMLPDMDLCRQFMVSAILSPGDMISKELLYGSDTNELPTGVTGAMLEEVKERFNDAFPLEDKIEEIISNALYIKGAHPILILPENSIDYTINSNQTISTESLLASGQINSNGQFVNVGILGPADGVDKPSVENIFLNLDMSKLDYSNDIQIKDLSISIENNSVGKHLDETTVATVDSSKLANLGKISVHDNQSLLRLPAIQERIRQQRIKQFYGSVLDNVDETTVSNEDYTVARYDQEDAVVLKQEDPTVKLDAVQDELYPDRKFKVTPLDTVMTPDQLSRPTKGNPLVIEGSVGALIPIYVPGNPSKHIGYWGILDANGNFVEMSTSGGMGSAGMCGQDPMTAASQILDTAMLSSYGYRSESQVIQDELARSYGSAVEADLLNRLRNGKLGSDYEIGMSEDVLRIMWSRALAKKNTVLLFIPAEFVVYVAHDYNEFGFGKSITESSKILAGIRANLTIASVLAAIKNSTGTRTARITLPEADDNPDQSVEYMMHQYYELNNNQVGLEETNHNVLMRNIQNNGINVVVDNHPLYPNVEFNVETREGTYKEPDTELMEEFRKQHIQSFGLSPEQIDASMGSDFAVSVIQNQYMTTKRVMVLQRALNPHLTRLIRIWSEHSEPTIKALLKIAKEARGIKGDLKDKPKQIVEHFLESLTVTLPKPKTQSYTDQKDQIEEYMSLVETVLDSLITDETLGDDFPVTADVFKALATQELLRQHMVEHNILPEAFITNTVGEGKYGQAGEFWDQVVEYVKRTKQLLGDISKKITPEEVEDDSMDFEDDTGTGDGDMDDMDTEDDFGSDDIDDADVDTADDLNDTDVMEEDTFEDGEGNVDLPDMPTF